MSDPGFDIAAHVNEKLGKRMGRRLSRALIQGPGKGVPMGLSTP